MRIITRQIIIMDELVQGKQRWKIQEKLAEGDAGEVYLVTQKDSLSGDQVEAILKRPRKNPAYAIRQATQIKLESDILVALQDINVNGVESLFSVKATELLDRGVFTNTHPEKFFMVIEKAEGISLDKIQRIVKSGTRQKDLFGFTNGDQILAKSITKTKRIPEFVLLSAIYGCLHFLDYAHSRKSVINGEEKYGMVWNDPKPDHVFWSCEERRITIIDWGNGGFLEKDRVTADRESSAAQDNIHFLEEFGKFLENASPSLLSELSWNLKPNYETIESDVMLLKESIQRSLTARVVHIKDLRRTEEDILQKDDDYMGNINKLSDLQGKILEYGLLPDYKKSEDFYFGAMVFFAKTKQFSECEILLDKLRNQPLLYLDRWGTTEKILKYITLASNNDIGWSKAIVAACNGRWVEVLWNLVDKIPADIFANITRDIRYLLFGIEKNVSFPFDALIAIRNKVSNDPKKYDAIVRFIETWKTRPAKNEEGVNLNYNDDVKTLKENGLSDVDLGILVQALDHPKMQFQSFITEWKRSNFDAAQEALRRLFVLDPDRNRLIWAFEHVGSARNWLGDLLNLVSVEDTEIKGIKQKISVLLRGGNFFSKSNTKLMNLLNYGKFIQSVFGDAPWLNKRILAIELYMENPSREHEFYQLLKNDSQLWQEFQPLVGPDFFEKFESKEKEKLRRRLGRKIEVLYGFLKIWHPAGYTDKLSDLDLKPWKGSYTTLLHAMRESLNGNYINLDQLSFPNEDEYHKDAIGSIDIIKQWESKLMNSGIVSAGEILKSHHRKKWFNLQEVVSRQKKLDSYIDFFGHIKNKRWEYADRWVRNSDEVELRRELIEMLMLLNVQTKKFNQDSYKYTRKEFYDLSLSSIDLQKEIQSKISSRNPKDQDFLLTARDWNVILSLLNSLHVLTFEISKENPKHWGWQKKGVNSAYSYLEKMSFLEELITGKKVKSSIWIDAIKQIIENAKTPEQVHLDADHPLYGWIIDYCDFRKEKMQVTQTVKGFAVLMLIVGCLVVGGAAGGKVFYELGGFGIFTEIYATEPSYDEETVSEDNANGHESPTAIILPTAILSSTEDVTASVLASPCDEYLSYFEHGNWVGYEAKLILLGESGFNDLQKLCGLNLSYETKLLQIKLYRLYGQLQSADDRNRIRTIQNELRVLLDRNAIPYKDLLSRRLSPEVLNASLQWLIHSTEICAINQGIPLLADLPVRNDNYLFLRDYINEHENKFIEGKDALRAICGLGDDEFAARRSELNENRSVNLLQDWPMYSEDMPCMYTTQEGQTVLFHFYPKRPDDKVCPSPFSPSITIGQFSYLEAHLCIVNDSKQSANSYGIYINEIFDIDANSSELGGNPNRNNPGCDIRQYIDIKASRIGNFLLWQVQVTDLRSGGPIYIPESLPLTSLQVLPEELMYKPLEVGFWAQPSPQNIHILISELFVIPVGETQ